MGELIPDFIIIIIYKKGHLSEKTKCAYLKEIITFIIFLMVYLFETDMIFVYEMINKYISYAFLKFKQVVIFTYGTVGYLFSITKKTNKRILNFVCKINNFKELWIINHYKSRLKSFFYSKLENIILFNFMYY